MENVDMFNAATAPLTFHDFLDRMRHPQAIDLVKSIKSFIVEFTSRTPDAERDSESVQTFLSTTEGAFDVHPLFVDATDEELDSAGEGLEKYLMTKLFSRAFAPFPEEVDHDQRLSEKMAMLQQFIRPEHLDIPPNFYESSWLLAQKELQKINTYKAPRDKLVCILNCCRVINNLLLNVSIGSKENPPGADDFLPVLIYVVIKANPPQLHSNLLYINRYRRQSRLVSEAAYFYTNLVSAEHFIDNLEATSLSMDSSEFEKQMHSARALLDVNLSAQPSVTEKHPPFIEGHAPKLDEHVSSQSENRGEPGPGLSVRREDQVESRMLPVEPTARAASAGSGPASLRDELPKKGHTTAAQLEASGLPEVLEAEKSGELARDYPYLFARTGDLRVVDVENLLSDYKELVLRYVALCKAVEGTHSPSGSRKVTSPRTDVRETFSTSRTAGEPQRSTGPMSPVEPTSPMERLALGEDRTFAKEGHGEVETVVETEAPAHFSSLPSVLPHVTALLSICPRPIIVFPPSSHAFYRNWQHPHPHASHREKLFKIPIVLSTSQNKFERAFLQRKRTTHAISIYEHDAGQNTGFGFIIIQFNFISNAFYSPQTSETECNNQERPVLELKLTQKVVFEACED